MSNPNLRQKLRHATVLYETKRERHDDVVQERDDDDAARGRIQRGRQSDDDAAVRVQIERGRHSDDAGDDKGVGCTSCAFVQKLCSGRIDMSALSVGSRYTWPTHWIVIAKHP